MKCWQKLNQKQHGMIDMLENLKARPTFAEQWPDSYKTGLMKGKSRQLSIESIRTQSITLAEILSQDTDVYEWWNAIDG